MRPMIPTSSAPTGDFNTTLVELVLLDSSASSQPWLWWLCLAALLITCREEDTKARIRVRDARELTEETRQDVSAREGKPTPTPTRLAEARHSASSRYQESVWHPLVGVPRAAAFSPLRRRQTLQPSRFLFDCIPMPQSGQRILSWIQTPGVQHHRLFGQPRKAKRIQFCACPSGTFPPAGGVSVAR